MHYHFPYFGADLRLTSLSQTPANTARPWIRASVSRGVPVYSPAFAGTNDSYLRRDGQAELTWVAGSNGPLVLRRSPIQVLTGPGVAQPTRYH